MLKVTGSEYPNDKFTEGNPQAGLPASPVSADFLNAVMDEIVNAIEGLGVNLTGDNNNLLSALLKSPISGSYNKHHRYQPGEILRINGNYYECYHPQGCLNKDPRDPKNRPAGWTNTDQTQPYHWIRIGKFLSLPEIGVALPFPTLNLREGVIKYNGDANLHKDKFWRLAELYPNLISNNKIAIADLRAQVIRGLDDARGIDVNRLLLSEQMDALQNHGHRLFSHNRPVTYGASSSPNAPALDLRTVGNGNLGGAWYHASDTFVGVDGNIGGRRASETRVKNIAKLFGTRI